MCLSRACKLVLGEQGELSQRVGLGSIGRVPLQSEGIQIGRNAVPHAIIVRIEAAMPVWAAATQLNHAMLAGSRHPAPTMLPAGALQTHVRHNLGVPAQLVAQAEQVGCG